MICTAKLPLYPYKLCWVKTILQKTYNFVLAHQEEEEEEELYYCGIKYSNSVGCRYISVGNLMLVHISVGFKISVFGFPSEGEIEM